jgi:viroplasmin and RNaseH domain-containing protein
MKHYAQLLNKFQEYETLEEAETYLGLIAEQITPESLSELTDWVDNTKNLSRCLAIALQDNATESLYYFLGAAYEIWIYDEGLELLRKLKELEKGI